MSPYKIKTAKTVLGGGMAVNGLPLVCRLSKLDYLKPRNLKTFFDAINLEILFNFFNVSSNVQEI